MIENETGQLQKMSNSTPDLDGAVESTRHFLIRKIWNGIDPFANFKLHSDLVDIQGWSGSNHPWFETAIRELRPRIIVEIGVWKGASALYMANVLRQNRIDGVVVAVDTWLGAADHWQSKEWFSSLRIKGARASIQDTFMNNVVSKELQNYIIPLPLDSANAATLLGDLGILSDVIHIDAGHDYFSVATDLAVWWPRLRTGGILIGDDYYHDGSLWPGVKAAFEEFTTVNRLTYDHLRPKIRIMKVENKLEPSANSNEKDSDFNTFDLLPDVLDYVGEFGAELVLFLPFCNWLSKAGLLKKRCIKTYVGMKCFYEDIDCLEIIYKDEKRVYLPPENRLSYLPIKNEHNFDNIGRSPFHFFPDQRSKFVKLPLLPDISELGKPLLIIHNKYNDEWGLGAINYIPLETLEILFQVLKHKFTIVYIRHGIGAKNANFSEDRNTFLLFEDRALLKRHSDVVCFETLFESHVAQGGKQDINTFKNVLYSRCYYFITSQGGGAHHIAQFSGSLLIVLHRQGSDEHWAYGDGYYGFMAPVPPFRAICRTESDLVRALPLLFSMPMGGGRCTICTENQRLLDEFSPWTISQRRVEK